MERFLKLKSNNGEIKQIYLFKFHYVQMKLCYIENKSENFTWFKFHYVQMERALNIHSVLEMLEV